MLILFTKKVEVLLKSCAYCGRIHDKKYTCIEKDMAIKKRQRKDSTMEENKFRWSRVWKRKAEEIKQRDKYLCQVCMRELYNTTTKYNTHNLEVHHAVGLREDFSARLDNNNLITLCREHHEEAECGSIPLAEIKRIIREQEGD